MARCCSVADPLPELDERAVRLTAARRSAGICEHIAGEN